MLRSTFNHTLCPHKLLRIPFNDIPRILTDTERERERETETERQRQSYSSHINRNRRRRRFLERPSTAQDGSTGRFTMITVTTHTHTHTHTRTHACTHTHTHTHTHTLTPTRPHACTHKSETNDLTRTSCRLNRHVLKMLDLLRHQSPCKRTGPIPIRYRPDPRLCTPVETVPLSLSERAALQTC